MNPLRALLGPLVNSLVGLVMALLSALKVPPQPWHEKAARLGVVALLVGAALLGGVQLDWATLAPLLGDVLQAP